MWRGDYMFFCVPSAHKFSQRISRFTALAALHVVICVQAQAIDLELSERLPLDEARALSNPVPHTAASLKKGKFLFMQHCAACHDRDGKARAAMLADAADLTMPDSWSYGDSDGEIFRTVRDGAGTSMPPFKYTISNERDLWNIANFVHSLRAEARPVENDKK